MTLGERISKLRSQHNMSQGDLAERMNVSRQSISKWETNGSVPDLDKLIQLSEIFHITLDELVKGHTGNESDMKTESKSEVQPVQVIVQKQTNTRKVIGIVLLCFGLLVLLFITVLGSFLGGLIFCSPFILCGAICLVFKKNVGLWCAWVIFLTVNLYLRYATGITWRLTLLTLNFEPWMNYMRLAFAWIELICFIAMIAITVLRFHKKGIVLSKRSRMLYAAGWIVFTLLFIPVSLDPQSDLWLMEIRSIFLDWIKVGLFTPLLITTLRLIRTRKTATAADTEKEIDNIKGD